MRDIGEWEAEVVLDDPRVVRREVEVDGSGKSKQGGTKRKMKQAVGGKKIKQVGRGKKRKIASVYAVPKVWAGLDDMSTVSAALPVLGERVGPPTAGIPVVARRRVVPSSTVDPPIVESRISAPPIIATPVLRPSIADLAARRNSLVVTPVAATSIPQLPVVAPLIVPSSNYPPSVFAPRTLPLLQVPSPNAPPSIDVAARRDSLIVKLNRRPSTVSPTEPTFSTADPTPSLVPNNDPVFCHCQGPEYGFVRPPLPPSSSLTAPPR